MSSLAKKRIKINVPETYKKVSDDVWKELETYLYDGFLTVATTIQEKPFVFKTINHHELRLISYTNPFNALNLRGAFRAQFIAYSIFMADGHNVLPDRSKIINRLVKMILKLPDKIQDKIIENLSILNQRTAYLYPLIEVYAYENRSKVKWLHTKSAPIHSSMNTGIPGTDEIGMNSCQQIWTALSQVIERRDEIERDWSHAKFIGSCFAGKGIKAIDERDKMRLEKERVDREELKLQVLFRYLNRSPDGKEPEVIISLPDGRRASVVKKFNTETAEELAEEMSTVVSGEKDYHDLVIEQKQREMQARSNIIEKERLKMTYSMPRYAELPFGGSRILGGKAEAEALLKRMNEAKETQRAKIINMNPDIDPETSDEEE